MFTPGPVQVPAEVLLAGARPTVHHRSADFPPVLDECQAGLKKVFLTESPVAVLATSGTGAVEAAMISTASPGDTIIVPNAGKFGERWVKVGKVYGLNVIELKDDWGNPTTPERIAEALRAHPEARFVVVPQTETSTGTVSDIKGIAAVTRNTPTLLIVDAVSAFLAEEMRTDEWGVDIVCTSSQKAMMLPPGLGFASVSKRAEAAMASAKCPAFYLDLRAYLKAFSDEGTPFTPAVNLFFSLQEALKMALEEGVEEIWARHQVLARAQRRAMTALGLTMFSKSPSSVLTAVNLPAGVAFKDFNGSLKANGITIAGGQDHLKGKIFRISTLGNHDTFDAVTIVTAVELALRACGWKFTLGTGVGAALEVLSNYAPAPDGWRKADAATKGMG